MVMPNVWHEGSYAHLEDTLDLLHSSYPHLHRHVIGRYLMMETCSRRLEYRRAGYGEIVPLGLGENEEIISMPRADGNGRVALIPDGEWRHHQRKGWQPTVELVASGVSESRIPVIVETWQPWVEPLYVEMGVAWIDENFPCEPKVPRALVDQLVREAA
jgi:hypothetical protein